MVVTEDRNWYSMVKEVTYGFHALCIFSFNLTLKFQGDDDLPGPEQLLERILSSHDTCMKNGAPNQSHVSMPFLSNLLEGFYSWSENLK
jgi:hypothetical protein